MNNTTTPAVSFTIVQRLVLLLVCLVAPTTFAQQTAVQWWKSYTVAEANGEHVLGLWKFDGDGEDSTRDASAHAHKAMLRGATWNAEGRFGGCLESSAGYPVIDKSHGMHVAQSPALSPRGPFSVEMWIKAKDEKDFPKAVQPVLLDMKYVPYNHTGFMFSLTRASGDDQRQMAVEIGMGTRSEKWYSRPFQLKPAHWRHVAFSYDAGGTVAFLVDGAELSRTTKSNAGPMAAATRPLSIGDRIGSLYNGFPGFIDEVRLTSGIREFRPVKFEPKSRHLVYVRMTKLAKIRGDLINQTGERLEGGKVTTRLPGGVTREMRLPPFVPGGSHYIEFILDSSLKPGQYEVELTLELPNWGDGKSSYQATTIVPLIITPRALPHRMPVVMWGIGGNDGVVKEIPRLKEIGFTHCLGLGVDYQQVWDEGAKALPATPEKIRAGREMLDAALENDLKIVTTLAPARWLRTAKDGKPFLRVDRNGKHYGREDVSGVFRPVPVANRSRKRVVRWAAVAMGRSRSGCGVHYDRTDAPARGVLVEDGAADQRHHLPRSAGGLKGAKVLVMADCDVLTQSVVKAVQDFQAAGGLVIGDEEACPAIKPDLVIPRFNRTKRADVDRSKLQSAAKELREWLDQRYVRTVDSTNPDVVTRRRRFGTTDYVFAVNDNREFGSYVGGYGLVMEDGLPSDTTIHLNRKSGVVYDLVAGRELDAVSDSNGLEVPLNFGPCEGRLLMVTERPIRAVSVTTAETAKRGEKINARITVTDGESPLNAVVPIEVRIVDPEGVEAEFSGYYGAAEGTLNVPFDFAPNDWLGVWQFQATELASGINASGYVRLGR